MPGPRAWMSLTAVMSFAPWMSLWAVGLVGVRSEVWGLGDGGREYPEERRACLQAAYLSSKSCA